MSSELKLYKLNSHERDKNIIFHEGPHIYEVHGSSKNYISVTTIIHKFFPEFDGKKIAKMVFKKNFDKEDSPYYNMQIKDILKQWDDNKNVASKMGTAMHKNFELYFNDIQFEEDFKTKKEYELFLNFLKDHPNLNPFRTEWEVYDEDIKIAGSIDMLFLNEDGTLDICDWKRCKEIKKDNKFESGLYPLEDLPNTNYWHYTIQLNMYKRILEKNYNVKIRNLYLICIHDANDNYLRFDLPVLNKEIDLIYETRLKLFNNNN
jgi:ATP-dependent exoDNAse (exonuclease V) beta subunit